MEIKELADKTLERLKTFNIAPIMPALRGCSEGALDDVLNTNGCAYYQWVSGLLEEIKPKQIVELGGAMGVWDLMVLNSNYQDFKLHSITLAEQGQEFSFIKDTYTNFDPIVGNDLDLSNWKGLDLSKTDLWFFDSEHTPEQQTKEFDLYSPFFKNEAVVLMDDIRSFGLWPVWQDLVNGKWGKVDAIEMTAPLHYSGYGMAICKR